MKQNELMTIMMVRFENMKKAQEEEAAKRIADERNKRVASERQVESNGSTTSNGKQHALPVTSNESVRTLPVSTIVHPSATSTMAMPSSSIYENLPAHVPIERTSTDNDKPTTPTALIAGVDVSSLLRQRKDSSPASNKADDNDDTEWADDHHTNNNHVEVTRKSPSPTPVISTNNSFNGNQHDGVRCIARYSYQKSIVKQLALICVLSRCIPLLFLVEEDELGFEENEVLTHVQKVSIVVYQNVQSITFSCYLLIKMHDEWWFGKIGTRSGLFPANYVEELP
jgi:hypothetical protein